MEASNVWSLNNRFSQIKARRLHCGHNFQFQKAEVARFYFADFFPWRAVASREGCFASARRSVFFRRRARFLALSLPLLCPIIPNLRPLVSPWQRMQREKRHAGIARAPRGKSMENSRHVDLANHLGSRTLALPPVDSQSWSQRYPARIEVNCAIVVR